MTEAQDETASMIRFLAIVCATALVVLPALTAGAQTQADDQAATTREVERPGRSGLPLPRFVSLRAGEVNMRTGPGVRYPIDWVYRKRYLPVEIIDEFDTWRQIRDPDGTVGWVHQTMLSGRRSVIVVEEQQVLRRDPDPNATGIVKLDPGVIGKLERCDQAWCLLEFGTYVGWLPDTAIYGVYPGKETP